MPREQWIVKHNNGTDVAPTPAELGSLRVKKLSENAVVPSRILDFPAGYDLFSAAEINVPARGNALVPTDLSIGIPEGTYACIAPRNDLACNHSIKVGAGVVDFDYRGPVGVFLFNHSDADFEVKVGDKIAYLIFVKIKTPEVANILPPFYINSIMPTEQWIVKHNNGTDVAPTPAKLGTLRVKKLSENAVMPSPVYFPSGYDLFSAAEIKVPARGKAMVPTDLSIEIPEGTCARISPRSDLGCNHSIDVGAGVVDFDYRGAVGVFLFNHSDADFEVKVGDKIAYLLLVVIKTPEVIAVDNLDSTVRGANGFGSTGV